MGLTVGNFTLCAALGVLVTAICASAALFGPPIACESETGGVASATEGCSGQHGPYYEDPLDSNALYEGDYKAVMQLVEELKLDVSSCGANPCSWYLTCPIELTCSDVDASQTGPTANTSRIVRLFVGTGSGFVTEANFTTSGTFTGDYLSVLDQMDQFYMGGVPGTLPASWAQGWTNVTWLQISNMSGEIPAAWFAPGAFQQLYNLDLSNGQLSGTLPASLGQDPQVLPQLYNLFLENNRFSGPLPPYIGAVNGSLPYLQELDLSNNSFTGALPSAWGSAGVPYLYTLSLAGNNLTGSLPESWGLPSAFGSIINLDLSRNALTGTLPAQWAEGFFDPSSTNAFLIHDVTFQLDQNELQGSIPAAWSHSATFNVTLQPDYLPNQPEAVLAVVLQPGNQICGAIPANVNVTNADTSEQVTKLPACSSS